MSTLLRIDSSPLHEGASFSRQLASGTARSRFGVDRGTILQPALTSIHGHSAAAPSVQ
jgi:hypothetical protein